MNRTRRGPLIAALATIGVALAAYVAVRLTSAHNATVTLAKLARNQQAYLGQKVTTTGTVRRFTDPDGQSYYILTDGRADRVILRPAATARRYQAQSVRIAGTFQLVAGTGRVLEIWHVRATG